MAKLANDYTYLIGDCLVAAGMVAYSGPFTSKYRQELEAEWRTEIEKLGVTLTKGVTMK